MVGHPRGRLLGGSSAINAQALIYPSKKSIDSWGMLGYPEWGWDTMVAYYQKFHTLASPSLSVSEALGLDYLDHKIQGKTGPIQASFPNMDNPIQKAWVDTFRNLNLHLTGDPLLGEAIGSFSNPCTINQNTKERSHAGSAYYAPVEGRKNLHLATEAHVEKILLEREGDLYTARGVQFTHQGATQLVRTRIEVILSAGTFQSPQILELSGIGNAELLGSHGIEVLVENPGVGENLQDHPMTSVSYEVNEGVMTGELMRDPEFVQAVTNMYSDHKTGPLCSGGLGSCGFLPLVKDLQKDGYQDWKQLLDEHLGEGQHELNYPAEKLQNSIIRRILESSTDASASFFMAPQQGNFDRGPSPKDIFRMAVPGNFISIGVSIQHPLSRGIVHINTADPHAKPIVDPRYLSHPLDLELYARHMLWLEELVGKQPLAGFLKPNGRRNAENAFMRDLSAAKRYLKETVASYWHPAGTCAMMPREIGGVVDQHLIVHGTTNLRVVDASIFPLIPRGNIQSSVYAVAERAADLIKGKLGAT